MRRKKDEVIKRREPPVRVYDEKTEKRLFEWAIGGADSTEDKTGRLPGNDSTRTLSSLFANGGTIGGSRHPG